MKIYIDGDIRIAFKDLPRETRLKLMSKFTFSTTGYQGKVESVSLISFEEIDGQKWLKFPCNKDYFLEALTNAGYTDGYQIIDTRVLPQIEGLTCNLTLREEQEEVLGKAKDVDYNCVITASTGFGKTASSIYLAQELKTSMLFIASRTSLLDNLLKDCKKFGVDSSLITKIDSDWLENPVVTPIMYCTSQTLANTEIMEKLYNQVGLLIVDESHITIFGEKTRQNIGKINPKYRIYLSATPEHSDFVGLTRALLSPHFIDNGSDIDFNIHLHEIVLDLGAYVREKYYETDKYHTRKNIIFSNEKLLEAISKTVAYIVKTQKRGVLIYLEDSNGHRLLEKHLKHWDLKVGVLNSDTKKDERKKIINGFDKKEYEVVIGGSSLSAGLSFYSLSVIINLNLTLNSNNLTQLLGRLKRLDATICNKNKNFVQIVFKRISERSWKDDVKSLNKFDFIKFENKFEVNIEDKGAFKLIADKIL